MNWKRVFFLRKYRCRPLQKQMLLWLAVFAAAVLLLLDAGEPQSSAAQNETVLRQSATAVEPLTETVPGYDAVKHVPVITQDGRQLMQLDDYLTGVVFAEMPTSFSMEALKAQTVAARTFTLKTCRSSDHNGAVCTDSSCCQAWMDPALLLETVPDAYEKVRQAIAETDGIVAVYQGELIDAVYFSCSGGKTEDASDVWGGEVAYLRSVESPGEEIAAHYADTVSLSIEAFSEIVLAEQPQVDLTGSPQSWIGTAMYTEGGGIDTLDIGGRVFDGTDLRAMFGLRSTAFSVSVTEESVVFETAGFGHRVGLSQYGAEAMARAGADFREILLHYYSGVSLKELRK